MSDATLNDPDADYPESRVIKFDADGNVVVESLDEDYGTERINSHPQTRAVEPVKHTKFSVFHFNNDDEKKFWDNLSLHAQRDIVDLSPYTVIQKIREQMKHRLASHTGCDHKPDKLCNCPYCNRGQSSHRGNCGSPIPLGCSYDLQIRGGLQARDFPGIEDEQIPQRPAI